MKNRIKTICLLAFVGCLLAACDSKNEKSTESASVEPSTESSTQNSVQDHVAETYDSQSTTAQYATSADIIKREETEMNGEKYILYTLKGNKAVSLPASMTIEEAQIDLSLLPEVGTLQEEVEKAK